MDFRTREESFEAADRRYGDLVRQREEGAIGEEEFDAQRQRLMVRDEEGRWWARLGEEGEWHYRDGGDWVRGNPPDYGETVALDEPPPPEETGGRIMPQLPPRLQLAGALGAALLAVALLWALVSYLQGGGEFDAAMVHRATPQNISANSTYIDDPLTNGNPEAVIYVTQNWNPRDEGRVYNDHSIGVWYDPGRERWAIFNQDRAAMTEGASFNVAILEEPPR